MSERVYFGYKRNDKAYACVREDGARSRSLNYNDNLWKLFKLDWGPEADKSRAENLAIRLVCDMFHIRVILDERAKELVNLIKPIVKELPSGRWTLTEAEIRNQMAQGAILSHAEVA